MKLLAELLERLLDKPTPTPEEVAKLHGVPVKQVLDQLKLGVKVELEHTSDPAVAREIALDHLREFPDYYDRLKRAES